MSRKSRTISKSGVYHIMLRSINQQQIFADDNDYKKFLYILKDVKEKYPFDLYAYCLMGNHIRAHICNAPKDYRWSSYKAYYRKSNTLIKKELAIQIAGSVEKLHTYFHSHQCEIQKKYPPPKKASLWYFERYY